MSSHKLSFNVFDNVIKKLNSKFMQIYTIRSANGTSGQIQGSSNQNLGTRNPVIREFEPIKNPEDTKNLIMGSGITARIRSGTVPNDTIIHSNRDSTTEEKLKLLFK